VVSTGRCNTFVFGDLLLLLSAFGFTVGVGLVLSYLVAL